MASSAGQRSNPANGDVKSPKDKGKGKSAVATSMEEDSEEDASVELSGDESMEEESDEDIEMNEEEEMEEAVESDSEINPSAILSNRRRKPRVDYTSKEALEKAGLLPEEEGEVE